MSGKILLTPALANQEYDSAGRRQGLAKLAQYGNPEPYSQTEFTPEHAPGVTAIIADSALFTREFYQAANELRIVARWGVGFDKVNVEIATELGIIITVSPVHMDTVAEYAIAQWLATLKRTYTLNHLSHNGDFSIIRTYDAQGSTLGLYGFGRIGQQVALRVKDLLRENGRLLVYDTRPDIKELAAQYGAEAVDSPQTLFAESDTISLHVAGDDTIVHYDLLCAMQPHASLINPSRGNLVNDADVNRAIKEERLYYYVVDDPVNGTRAIHKDHPRIICTNHNGGITAESTTRLDLCTIDQVCATLQNQQPDHILNPAVLDHPRVKAFLG
jgi:D-3-phosphoglycerate dehydrogenase